MELADVADITIGQLMAFIGPSYLMELADVADITIGQFMAFIRHLHWFNERP